MEHLVELVEMLLSLETLLLIRAILKVTINKTLASIGTPS
jgi:hypothetical protein